MALGLLVAGCGGSSSAGKDAHPDATVDQGHADSSPKDGGAGADGAATDATDAGSDVTDSTDVVTTDAGVDATDAGTDAGVDATGATDVATDAGSDGTGATDAGPDATGEADAGSDAAATDADSDGASSDGSSSDTSSSDGGAADGDAADEPPIQGPLRAYWRLDEGTGTVTADSSANAVTSTLYNGATWTTTGFPAATFTNPAALVLDGVDDYVDLGVRAIPHNDDPKTVSLWFWQAAPSTAAARENLISLTDFLNTGNGTQIGLDAGHASVWFMGETAGLVTDPTAAAAGWHHLAYSYDGAVHRLYIDAVLVGQATRASTVAPVTTAFLGGFNVLGLEMFAGRIDDVRIYDSALGLATITAINGGAAP